MEMIESNQTRFYGPSEHALCQKLIKLTEALLPLLAKVDQNPDAGSESVPVSSYKNPLRNPIESTAGWQALMESQNPLRDPVKDIEEFKTLK